MFSCLNSTPTPDPAEDPNAYEREEEETEELDERGEAQDQADEERYANRASQNQPGNEWWANIKTTLDLRFIKSQMLNHHYGSRRHYLITVSNFLEAVTQ